LHLLFIPSSMPTASYIFSLHDALPIFDRIFAAQMKASAADLLGQYRSLHRENGERVRRHDGDEQRHESIEVMRQFQNEDDRSERSEETRLNSSHDQISYAVFCLKKKKK